MRITPTRFILTILAITLAVTSASCDADTGEPTDTSIIQPSDVTEPLNSSTTQNSETNQNSETTTKKEPTMTQFYNPISTHDASDPFMTYDPETGYYYAIFTQGDRLELYRSKQASRILADRDSKVIYRPDGSNGIWGSIWAPEMHRGTDGLWYIYTSGRITKEDGEKRVFIIGSLTSDPFGEWEYKRKPAADVFSIDPTVYTAPDGTQYMCYSRVDPEYGQVLDIAKMKSPTTIYNATMIAKAELEWELVEPYTGRSAILEGAFFLENNGRLFLIYSANGCWSNNYCLGVLEYTGGDMCSPENWEKHPEPLLVYGNGVYGPGHASFFRSPDGTEVWCAYHGMKQSNDTVTPAPRYFYIQKVDFDATGYPVMGQPVGYVPLTPPSGE